MTDENKSPEPPDQDPVMADDVCDAYGVPRGSRRSEVHDDYGAAAQQDGRWMWTWDRKGDRVQVWIPKDPAADGLAGLREENSAREAAMTPEQLANAANGSAAGFVRVVPRELLLAVELAFIAQWLYNQHERCAAADTACQAIAKVYARAEAGR